MFRNAVHLVRCVRAIFIVNVLESAQYRVGMFMWASASLLQVTVYLSVWRAVAEARGGTAAGFTPNQFAGYFLILLIVREATYTWTAWQMEEWVQLGKLSPLLLRPVHPLAEMMGSMAAYRLQSVVMLVPAAGIIWFAFDAEVHTSVVRCLLTLLLFTPITIVRFFGDSCLACLAFWLTRVGGIRNMYYVVLLFLSGQFAPIQALPKTAQIIAHALPFYWVLGYPTELLSGSAPLSSVPHAMIMLTLWMGVLYLLLRAAWARGVARYGAVGA